MNEAIGVDGDADVRRQIAEPEEEGAARRLRARSPSAKLIADGLFLRQERGRILHARQLAPQHARCDAIVREAPEDEVVRCEECRRILVRTADSGL